MNTLSLQVFGLGPIELLILAAPIVVVALVLRCRSDIDKSTAWPKARPGWKSRSIEAFLLAAIGTLAVTHMGFNRHFGGYMGNLDQLQSEYANLIILVFVCAMVAVVFASAVALAGRTALAVCLVAIVLGGNAHFLRSQIQYGKDASPDDITRPIEYVTLSVTGSDIRGGELWINGVHMGPMPATFTRKELAEKVPHWPRPPKANIKNVIRIPSYDMTGSFTSEYVPCSPVRIDTPFGWRRGHYTIDMPQRTQPQILFLGEKPAEDTEDVFYVRIKNGEEWSIAPANRHIGPGGSGSATHMQYGITATFPRRDANLDTLLDMARLADYKVGPAWFAAADTYHDDGWRALRKAAMDEPRMLEVLQAWAQHRYDLHTITDETSAWAALERIRADVGRRRQYNTADVAGMAVELLADKLNVEQLCDLAEELLKKSKGHRYSYHHEFGRLQFGCDDKKSGKTHAEKSANSDSFPCSGFPVAHAVWLIHESQRDQRFKGETEIQKRIGPALARKHNYKLAAYIGGHEVDSFLLRNDWQKQPDQQGEDYVRHMRFGRELVNFWLYLLANLDSPTGKRFRASERLEIMDMADTIIADGHNPSDMGEIDFIFMDRGLTKTHWPRFARQIRRGDAWEKLTWQWQYLLKMEPASTVETYVQCAKELPDRFREHEYLNAIRAISSLPPAKRTAIIEGVIEYLQGRKEAADPRGSIHFAINRIERIFKGEDEPALDHVIEELAKFDGNFSINTVGPWLEHTEPTSPLVGMLAEHKDPVLRAMAIAPCRVHPTADHRTILTTLAADPDETVRTKAHSALTELAELAKTDPMAFADPPR